MIQRHLDQRRAQTQTLALAMLTTAALVSCASLKTFAGGCGSGANCRVCLGPMTVPKKQQNIFESASNLAIDAIHSEGFKVDLRRFAPLAMRNPQYGGAWQNFDVDTIVASLANRIAGVTIETYGGVGGLWLSVIYGNTAYDGDMDGPIRLNRWALPRSEASVANTIAHEIAHRVGLRHPHSDKALEIAICEPPYVIGTLVEKQSSGRSWALSPGDCADLKPILWGN